uniref:ADAM metallopeptidase with thrombospondin type 1 motif 7 n=1 Tax=Varanus komodoensis TaxID=61221 RepID=A0A8D2Q856_VARKO
HHGGPAHYDIVYPVKVDERGAFLSYNLSHRLLSKRALFAQNRPLAFYRLDHRGQQLRFNLSLNRHLLAPGFVSERRYGGIAHAKIRASHQNSCHMIGSVQNQEQDMGLAALSTCDGLRGVFRLANEDFFIEPLPPSSLRGEREAHSHRVYRRHVPEYEAEEFISAVPSACFPGRVLLLSSQREKWEERQQKRRRLRQRSVSKEKWVETLVVADAKMVQHHGSEHVEKYVLTVMNMVAGLFHDASIGNPIHISIVRLISLEEEEKDLKITHHADNTLRSFCKWQKAINIKGDAHPLHHDVAVLLTRKDLCTAMNHPCETLGLSHVSGMCQPHRSCNINEDTGLPLAFTVAHELGHSFGIQHDGSGNDCEPVGKRPFIMSPQLLYDTSPLTWSHCSREYITRFLDRGWGLCLDDPPAKDMIDFLSVPPGVLYDVGHQCRLQYGPYSTYCDDMDNVCSTLWCSVGNTCHSKLDAAVDGTRCDDDKWCFDGECVRVGHRPEPVDGGWAAWSSWAGCSRTCGGGVQNAERQCSSPTPKYGGKFCLGERKRFRVCSTQPCPAGKPSFRHVQCSYFDARPYKGKLYKWTPVPNKSSPCELHCRPENGYFAEKLRDAVADGTPCYEGSARRDLCINGICKNVGCDYEIDSYAVEDRCGMCRGDGSTCQTVKRTFEEREGRGYVDVGLIPAGAREIQIEEVAEAENFLALRSEDPEKYFLNGGWTIQWNGDYQVAGTTFTYKRTGNWENLTSPGPTEEPVWIQLLFQEKNPGIRYQYTIQREADSENEIAPAEFFWQYGSWTACTASCGTGVQRQTVRCTEKVAGVVEDRYCGALSRPDDKQRSCGEEPCPARWWTGEWQACSATCGDTGLMRRTILCIQSVAPDEQQALPPSECQHLPRPDATAPCNRERLCPAQWATGNWTQCSVTCGSGTQERPVRCPGGTRAPCDAGQRPVSRAACSMPPCGDRAESSLPDWSGSGSSSRELFNEIHFLPNRHVPKPSSSQPSATGLNVLLEDNFPSSSSRQGNVFVDDFYYDYNFINFHEDLSLDPAGEMDGRKEGSDPDAEEQTPEGTTKGPEETHPGLLLTARPEDGVEGTSTAPAPRPRDEGEANTIQDHGILAGWHDPPDATVATTATTSSAVQEKRFWATLLPGSPSTSAATSSPASSGSRVSGTTHGAPLPGRLLGEDTAATVPSFGFPGMAILTPTVPPGWSSRSQGSTSGAPGRRDQDLKSLVLPGHDDGEEQNSWETVEVGNGEPSNAGKADGSSAVDTPHGAQDAWLNPVGMELAGTSRPAGHSAPPPARSTKATLELSMQNGKELDHTVSSPILGSNQSKVENTQNPPRASTRGTLSPPADPLPEGPSPSDPHSPGAWGQQAPTKLEPTLPSPSPSTLAAPREKEASERKRSPETKPALSPKAHGPFQGTEESLPNGIHWIFAPGSPGWGPGLTTAVPQEAGKSEAPPVVPPAVGLAAANASWESGNWSEASSAGSWQEPFSVWRACFAGVGALCRGVSPALGSPGVLGRTGLLRAEWAGGFRQARGAGDPAMALGPERTCSRPSALPSAWQGPEAGGIQARLARGAWAAGAAPGAGGGRGARWAVLTAPPFQCSATCGLGAIWRTVRCSSGVEAECDPAGKPSPARRCYLGPCAAWRAGAWSKCSKACGGGVKLRDVHCADSRDQRPLRPFHCQAVPYKPPTQAPCHTEPCLRWYTSPWRECSEPCGAGEQERLVTCPEVGRCDEAARPDSTRVCNTHPCTKWTVGSWGQCTATCGGGIQRRQVKCVNTRTGEAEEDSGQCGHELWPESSRPGDCPLPPSGFVCERNRLSFGFCQTLLLLGRCHLPTVRIQCCQTCHQHGPGHPERGNQRASRK